MANEQPTETFERLHAGLAGKIAPLFQPPGGADDDLSGRPVGPYKLLQRIGTGGFGEVYMAEQQEPVRRRVALKIIKLGMDTKQVIARFEAERQALAMMDHPNIAKVLDAAATETGRPYFVMELVKGEPITAYCDRKNLSIAERLNVFSQVCQAVQHAHQKAVIHRDIKPSNVLVSTVDGRPLAKVIDFGIAKATDHRLTEKTLFTAFHQMIGTPEYMSPEQAGGSPDIDTRSDIYSLGVLLYELLTGTPPLDSKQLRSAAYAEMQRIIREVEPHKPSTRLNSLGETGTHTAQQRGEVDPKRLSQALKGDLDWIVMKCLEKDRARRYESANGLAIDIRRYLGGEAVLAAPPSAVYRFRKFVRRHRAGVLIGGGIGVLLALGIAGTTVGLVRSERQRRLAQSHAEEAEAVTSFLSNMLASVGPAESGRESRVRDILDRAAQSIGTELSGRPLVEARLRHTIGNTYVALGLWEQAEPHLTAALDIRRRLLGDGHALTLTAMGNVASMRFHQGRYQEAESLLRSALEAERAAGAPENARTFGMMNNLAQIFVRQGRVAEAEELQSRVLGGQRQVHGPDHPDTLGAMVNLAGVRRELGQLDGAQGLLEEAVEGWRKTHGDEHPGTLLALSSLADLHLAQGRPMEAEAVQRRVLTARTRVLGEEHPDTLATMSNLARVLGALGRTAEAEPLLLRAWQLSMHVRGESHPDTVITASNLLELFEARGWPESKREQIESLLVGLRAAAARADATPKMLNDCAWLMLTVRPESLLDPKAAMHAAIRACELERAAGGVDLWQYLDTLALAQHRNGDPAGAAATQREAIRILPAVGERYRAEMQQRLAQYDVAATSGG